MRNGNIRLWLMWSIAVFKLPAHHQLIEDKQFENYRDKRDINIVLVNGVLWSELSDLKHLPHGLDGFFIK